MLAIRITHLDPQSELIQEDVEALFSDDLKPDRLDGHNNQIRSVSPFSTYLFIAYYKSESRRDSAIELLRTKTSPYDFSATNPEEDE